VVSQRPCAASEIKLTLVIYDHAHLSDGKLADVESITSEIFRRAGVQVFWVEGFAYAAQRRDVLIPAPEDPAALVVKLQPESEAVRYGVRSACGGIGFASGVIIFVRKFDPKSSVSDVTRIGYVIAHEIGHVLLGPNAHSIAGIMRGTLLQQDWENAEQGTLGFTGNQNQQIRTWIAERGSSGDAQWLSLTGLSAQPAETGLKIAIHLYNYSGVSAEVLARAEQETARIYQHLGVEMEWRHCLRTAEELETKTICDLPTTSTKFTLRLLSKEMAQRFPVHDDIFGFALLSINGGLGVVANVFADRAREIATGEETRAVILGHLIAHELGHLLLGEAEHPAGAGIMHTPWQTKELDQIKRGVMYFLPGQTERIRAQVLARTISEQTAPHR
jgi:hypothetical protein